MTKIIFEKDLEFCIFIAYYQQLIMDTKELKVSYKSKKSTSIFVQHFGTSINLDRIKFMSLFICALCKVQTVCFKKLAYCFDHPSKSESSLRHIQRFMADYVLNKDLIAKLIFTLLPHELPYTLVIDRTNWKFGNTDINVLVFVYINRKAYHLPTRMERIRL